MAGIHAPRMGRQTFERRWRVLIKNIAGFLRAAIWSAVASDLGRVPKTYTKSYRFVDDGARRLCRILQSLHFGSVRCGRFTKNGHKIN
jgi:hypothetical protein